MTVPGLERAYRHDVSVDLSIADEERLRKEAGQARRDLLALRQALLERLSPQERRILDHMADGHTNRQIAQGLSLAEKTVSNYVSSLLAKLGMHRRSEAAAFAARLDEQRSFGPRP